MNHNIKSPPKSDLEKVLKARFQNLRTEEKALLPDFPSEQELQERQSDIRRVTFGSISARHLSRIAATFLLVTFIGILATRFWDQQHQDPIMIYADIMKTHYSISTDELLVVSGSVSPEIAASPVFYDIDLDIEFEAELYAN